MAPFGEEQTAESAKERKKNGKSVVRKMSTFILFARPLEKRFRKNTGPGAYGWLSINGGTNQRVKGLQKALTDVLCKSPEMPRNRGLIILPSWVDYFVRLKKTARIHCQGSATCRSGVFLIRRAEERGEEFQMPEWLMQERVKGDVGKSVAD